MVSPENNIPKLRLDSEYKTIARNTFYSIVNTYGLFILSVFTSYFIARIISQEEWGILIIANSIILILIFL
ncbi:MAG: hypothetical protein ACFE8J_12255, partial [Candidatus Heimdallarchaeota archaeon]